MSKPDAPTDLDPRTARLARDWFAEARAQTQAEGAAKRGRNRPPARDGCGDGSFDRLSGDSDGDGVGD